MNRAAPITPELTVVDGVPTTTSLDVARHFGKRHDNVLDSIRRLLAQLPAERALNFQETFIDVPGPNGATRSEPAYRITRDGFTLLAMGFTGARALEFKLAYLDAFNRMEAEVARRALPAPDKTAQAIRLSGALEAAGRIGSQVQAEAFERFMRDEQFDDGRWLLTFVRDEYCPDKLRPHVRRLEPGTYVTTLRRLADNMSDPASMHKSEDLAHLARACLAKLERRAAYASQLEIAARQAKTQR